jgi:Xaa-Pro dipeptidase
LPRACRNTSTIARFSVEPGLFDPETGSGANFSDVFTVEPEGPALQMSRLPWSEEWHWIKI